MKIVEHGAFRVCLKYFPKGKLEPLQFYKYQKEHHAKYVSFGENG